jgi:hypothetical protein
MPAATASHPSETLAAFYRAISFRAGESPDWTRVPPLFLPGARMTLPRMPGVQGVCSLTVDAWGGRYLADMRRGSVSSFLEYELAGSSLIFGETAHLLSVFETKLVSPKGEQVLRGLYGVQLVLSEGRWLIVSMLWDFEVPGRPLPDLPAAAG